MVIKEREMTTRIFNEWRKVGRTETEWWKLIQARSKANKRLSKDIASRT